MSQWCKPSPLWEHHVLWILIIKKTSNTSWRWMCIVLGCCSLCLFLVRKMWYSLWKGQNNHNWGVGNQAMKWLSFFDNEERHHKIFAALELYKKKVLFLFYGQVICIDSYCFLEATSLRTPSECSAWNMGKLFEMQTCRFQKIPSAAAHKNSHIPPSASWHQTYTRLWQNAQILTMSMWAIG